MIGSRTASQETTSRATARTVVMSASVRGRALDSRTVTQPTDTRRPRGRPSARFLAYIKHPAHTWKTDKGFQPALSFRYYEPPPSVTDDAVGAGLAPLVVQAVALA
jgi:hypothetical protein